MLDGTAEVTIESFGRSKTISVMRARWQSQRRHLVHEHMERSSLRERQSGESALNAALKDNSKDKILRYVLQAGKARPEGPSNSSRSAIRYFMQ
jgi:hypothetical protein